MLMVFVLATSITVQASEVGASPEENTSSMEQVQVGVDDYDKVDSQDYTISTGEPNIDYSPIVLKNTCSFTGTSFTFSKSAEYKSIAFYISSNDPKAARYVKTAYVVIKLEEVPSSISDGTIITSKTISNEPLVVGDGYFENEVAITGYNSDNLMELPNGKYYIRAFVKDFDNVYSIGGLFSGYYANTVPYFEITD